MATEPANSGRTGATQNPDATLADEDLAPLTPEANVPTSQGTVVATGEYFVEVPRAVPVDKPAGTLPIGDRADPGFNPASRTAIEPSQAPPGQAGIPTIAETGIIMPEGSGTPSGQAPGPTQMFTVDLTENQAPPGPEGTLAFDPGGQAHPPDDRGFATMDMGATGVMLPPTAAATVTDDRSPRQRPSTPGESRCGRYVLKKFHAKGGMGEIWLAEDPSIGRQVALKRMLSHRPDQQYRFRVEAQVTGQLEHPGVVPIHELGVNEQDQPFYVMKFVNGLTLQKVIEKYHATKPGAGSREVEQFRLLQIFISLCQTVAYAHSRGVLHRDLKPENVMLGPYGETILLDWGIAKVMGQPENQPAVAEDSQVHPEEGDEDTQTRVGAIMGTPTYMAPETAAGLNEEVDHRSDVYLLGGTLYEILTGQLPRTAKTVFEMIKLAKSVAPAPARTINPEVPKALEAICGKAMALRKEDRYQSALELADDVQRFVAGEPVSAFHEDFLTRAWRWAKRHRKVLGRSAAALLTLSVLTVGVVKIREAERSRLAAVLEAEQLRVRDQARLDLREFRRLADEARFYAATTDPVSEHAPYFDPRKGEATSLAALKLAEKWGPSLEQLPLPEERDPLRREQYDLLLQTANAKSQQSVEPNSARETLALLDQAGRLHAPSRGYFRLRARVFQQLGDAKKAVEEQERADDPNGRSTALDHFLLGEKYRQESVNREEGQGERKSWQSDPERIEKAIDEYRQALGINPDDYWSRFQLGRCYLSLGRFAESVEALGACVALQPKSPWGYSVRGFALAQQKRYQEAEQELNRAIELSPDSRPPRLNRGVVFWSQGKQDAALADFTAVLQPPKEKELGEAAFYRGQLYLERGEIQKALADFDRVVAENPGFRPVYLHRARIQIAQGNNTRGLEELDTFLANGKPLDRSGSKLHEWRGHLLRLLYKDLPIAQRGKPSARALVNLAVTELRKAVNLGGKDPQIEDDLGAMLEFTGQIGEAINAYTQGLERDPKNVKLLIKRAWAFEALGQHDKALADFAAAARVEPENAEAHSGVGYVRALRQPNPLAQSEADMALVLGADQYLVLHNVACIYAAMSQAGDPQATAYQEVAIALLRRAIKLWKQEGTGPSELDLIKGESAFRPLSKRADFQALLRNGE